ncbi:hypothetical protein HII17_06545 [Thalassotalea sp. M1531]|uniref:Uncharacterized protein n=1 Tax=Thalassotalea algicola TaxID=2716224 RepID=A0A7Y0LBI6_9GAMM|nr:hypothetical protein [Thalassotalea algicola]NMP31214.1 hypothetical protein [Thalassotalea algicola]
MSAAAIALSAYLTALGESIQDENQQRLALNETALNIEFHGAQILFSHQQWHILDNTVCYQHDRNSPAYSDCTIQAKSLFNQICSALSNRATSYWHHQKYKEMYCDAAVNFQPMVATISYGESTQMSAQEKKCNQLILKALVNKDEASIKEKNEACKGISKK